MFGELSQLVSALAAGDSRAALEMHVSITTTGWADNGALSPLLSSSPRLILPPCPLPRRLASTLTGAWLMGQCYAMLCYAMPCYAMLSYDCRRVADGADRKSVV